LTILVISYVRAAYARPQVDSGPRLTSEKGFSRIQNPFDHNYTRDYGCPEAPINFETVLKVASEKFQQLTAPIQAAGGKI